MNYRNCVPSAGLLTLAVALLDEESEKWRWHLQEYGQGDTTESETKKITESGWTWVFYRDAVIIAILFISGVTRLWFISELGALIMKPIPAEMTYSYAIDYTESSSVCFT